MFSSKIWISACAGMTKNLKREPVLYEAFAHELKIPLLKVRLQHLYDHGIVVIV